MISRHRHRGAWHTVGGVRRRPREAALTARRRRARARLGPVHRMKGEETMRAILIATLFSADCCSARAALPRPTTAAAAVEDRTGKPGASPAPTPARCSPRVAAVDVTQARRRRPLAALKDPKNILSKRSIYYDLDKFDVKDEYRRLVEAHAKYLRENPRRHADPGQHRRARQPRVQHRPRPAPLRRREADDGAARRARRPDRVGEPRRGKAAGRRPRAKTLGQNRRSDILYGGEY